MTDHTVETSLRFHAVPTYARLAGVLFLLTIAAGGFGEFYVPSQLVVPADATATANNIVASESLFRLGFASYLVEAMCDIALALIFYVLLKPVRRDLALLAAFLGSCPPPLSPSPSSSIILGRRSSWEALPT